MAHHAARIAADNAFDPHRSELVDDDVLDGDARLDIRALYASARYQVAQNRGRIHGNVCRTDYIVGRGDDAKASVEVAAGFGEEAGVVAEGTSVSPVGLHAVVRRSLTAAFAKPVMLQAE